MRDLAGRAFKRVRVASATGRASDVRSPAAWEAGAEDGLERPGTSAGDPDGAEGESVPRRGAPEGEGAPCGQGDPGRQEPGAPPDAGARVAGPGAAGTAPRRLDPQRPDELWGTDASRFWTKAERWCWFFAAVDHCASDVVGWHVAKKGDRWAALEPVRQGVRAHMGGFDKTIALGLGLRHDWGSQYRAKQFQAEIKWLGIRSTPAYVGEPECNGVAERFIRTLKEECIYLHDFETLEEAREVIGAFVDRYNNGWLLQRHGYMTPARAREKLSRRAA